MEITIAASGVNPQSSTVAMGGNVTFFNDDTVDHEIMSDPHPAHTTCPELNIGVLRPGDRLGATLQSAGPCGFHDEKNADNTAFQGLITVDNSGSGGGGGGGGY